MADVMADADRERIEELAFAIGMACAGHRSDDIESAMKSILVDLIMQGHDDKADAMMTMHHINCAMTHAIFEKFDRLRPMYAKPDMGPAQGSA